MKLRLRLLVVAMLMIVLNTIGIQSASAVTNQMEWKYVQKALNYMQGNWYNDSGEKVITIHDKYINGCEVVSAFDFAGGSSFAVGVFRIQESTGVRRAEDIKCRLKSDLMYLDICYDYNRNKKSEIMIPSVRE